MTFPMRKTSGFLLTAVLAFSMFAGAQANAQGKSLTLKTTTPGSTIGQLKAAAGHQELKCTGRAGHATCTSKYAFVCPSGWSACSAPPGGTCCTQN